MGCSRSFHVLALKYGKERNLANKIEALVNEKSLPIIGKYNLEFVDCEYKKIGQEFHLTLFIDKKGGVTLDDCEKVSRELEEILDKLDPIDSEYILSVSSPGLDRALKKESDFLRNIDKKIYIKLYRAIDKNKEFIAILKAYDEDNIIVEVKNKKVTLNKKDIAVIKQHIDF